MVIVEKSFPRGGTTTKEKKSDAAKDNITFGALQKKIQKPKKKTKNDLSDLLEDAKADNIEAISAELLNYATIQDGMCILGIVKAIDQLYLSISLPGRMTARVSALEISDAYTKITKEFLQSSEDNNNYKSLKDLYNVGQIVYGRVQEIKQQPHGRTDINLTLRPAEVHADLQHANIKKGFVFNGAIEEVQEHGYIIESGIRGMRTFVPLDKSQPGHVVGELLYLKVNKITQDKTVGTSICEEISTERFKVKNQNNANLDYIMPGTIVQFNVTKLLKDGLQGSIMNETFTAYVNEHQLEEPLALPEDYEVGTNLSARVLYVMPLTKLVYLTLNLRTQKTEVDGDDDEVVYKRGDIVENAKVHRLGTGGVILVLNNKLKGVISYKAIKSNYKGNYDQDALLTRYAKKTNHKVRVLDYDLMDSLYICTDDANIVDEKVFSLDDLKPGEFVMAEIKELVPKIGGYTVQVGKVKGIIEKLFLAPSSKTLEEHAKVRCRIIAINTERKTVYLTNRPEYLDKSCKVLTTLTAAKKHAVFTGTIVQCNENYLLVKFFNNLKGVLHKHCLTGYLANEAMANFYIGQTMPFRIVSKKDEQITLSPPDDTFKLGEICPVTITHALESGLEIDVNFNVDDEDGELVKLKGLIPIRLLSDFVDLLHAKLHMFKENEEIQAVCINKNIFSLRDVEYFQQNLTKHWHSIKVGDIVKAFVKDVSEDVIDLLVPLRGFDKLIKLHRKMLLVNAYSNPNVVLVPEQVVYVKILGKEQHTKTITVTAKLTDVWNGQLSETAAYIKKYLKELRTIKKAFKTQGKSFAKYSIGDKVKAQFQTVNDDSKDWLYQLTDTKATAVVKASLVGKSKPPILGTEQECVVLWIDYSNELIFVCNKRTDIAHLTNGKDIPENIASNKSHGHEAKVLLKLENVFVCSLKKGNNPLVICPRRLHFNDFEQTASADIKEGDFCKLVFINGTKPIAVLESTWKLWQDVTRKRKLQEEAAAVKRKKSKLNESSKKTPVEHVTNEIKTKSKKLKRAVGAVVETNETNESKTSKKSKKELFYEDNKPDVDVVDELAQRQKHSTETAPTKKQIPVVQTLPGIGDFWNTDLSKINQSHAIVPSSDEEDDETVTETQKKKKLSTAEKFRQQRDEETALRTIEEKYADPKHLPESVDQFDRLVLSEPNNSKHWINYMVFHLQATEIDKGRAVARRAIKAISFRDADEQLNIWIALLNLELRYGNKTAFDETLKEALTYNEPLKIYLSTLEILSGANRTQELIEIIGVITKKFKAEQEVWKAAANAFFSIGMAERAQQLLHKALACLPEREHVNAIVVFANLNHKHGNNEMAQTLLDQIVTSYPKRVDVWTQYVDMLVKDNLIDSARAVLERAVIQKIPLKKMRTIFKKYLEFEERFGSDDGVQKVKKLATEYVKNNSNL